MSYENLFINIILQLCNNKYDYYFYTLKLTNLSGMHVDQYEKGFKVINLFLEVVNTVNISTQLTFSLLFLCLYIYVRIYTPSMNYI